MINILKNENWETLSSLADNEISNYFVNYIKKELTLYDLFYNVEKLPEKFEDSDICKETINKVFDHLIQLGEKEDSLILIYDKVRDEIYNEYNNI